MANILQSAEGAAIDLVKVHRALLSVSDKTGVAELGRFLSALGVELLSTGGTAAALRQAGLQVTDVSEYTGSPEILDGRVKTLHPLVHGGLLAARGNPRHEQDMQASGVKPIDLVVANLYAFEQTVSSGADWAACMENIDIGGPTMIRAAAKNHRYVTVVTSPMQYNVLVQELSEKDGCTSFESRKQLAARAFADIAAYDSAIASYFAEQLGTEAPVVTRVYERQHALKYGVNPHQAPSGIYRVIGHALPFTIVNGAPGYINLLDAVNAWQLVKELKQVLALPAAASFKHVSPAGAAVGVPLSGIEAMAYEVDDVTALSPLATAYVRARNADPMCSFGDFVAVSDIVDVQTAQILKREVSDGIIAPGFDEEAKLILAAKKGGKFIMLQVDENFNPPVSEYREEFGMTFEQRRNDALFTPAHLDDRVAGASFPEEAVRDLVLASIAVKYTQSNSVGYAKSGMMIGVGAGQQSRVDCVKLAGRKLQTWWLRQHPKVLNLHFKADVKRQDRVNARVRYIEGDFAKEERNQWEDKFVDIPDPLTEADKADWLSQLEGVSISSDAFFPFRDSIDHASKYGVKYVAQPGGSVADNAVIAAANDYGMSMAFTKLRLFHH